MFCENCGRPIPEGQENCQFCNPPAQEPAYAAPVFQPAPMDLTDPAPQQYASPVQTCAPPVQQPAFELNMPAEGARKKKKSGGGRIALILIALVLVAGIVLAALNWKSITRFFSRNFGEPTDYLVDVEKDSAADAAKTLADAYDQALASYHPEGSSADTTVTLEMGDTLMSLLSTALSQSGVEMELDWVQSITLTPQVDVYEDTMRVDLGVGINGTGLATLSVIWDMESQTIYIGVPELHDTYIQMDAREILGEEAAAVAETMAMSREMNEAVMAALPSGSELEALITRYVGIVLDQLSDAEKETETVKLGGLEQELLVMTVELSQKDILKLAEAVLEEAQDDAALEDILDGFSDMVNEMNTLYGGENVDLYTDFANAVDEALYELEYLVDEVSGGDFITIETFLDSKDTIVGRTVTVEAEGEEIEIYYITVTEGGEFAFKAEAATVRIEGEGTIEKGKRTGAYVLSESGTDYVTLEIEDYVQAEDDSVTGTFRLIPESIVYEMMDMDASVAGILGSAALELGLTGDSVRIAIEAAGSELLALRLSGQTAKPSPIALPEGVSTEDDAGGMQWLTELDFEAVLSNLEKAGVPDEYMAMAEQFVEMFRAEFN